MAAGKNYGIRNAGYYALRALRTEKFFAYWGTDLTPHNTPIECGREYRVKFEVCPRSTFIQGWEFVGNRFSEVDNYYEFNSGHSFILVATYFTISKAVSLYACGKLHYFLRNS